MCILKCKRLQNCRRIAAESNASLNRQIVCVSNWNSLDSVEMNFRLTELSEVSNGNSQANFEWVTLKKARQLLKQMKWATFEQLPNEQLSIQQLSIQQLQLSDFLSEQLLSSKQRKCALSALNCVLTDCKTTKIISYNLIQTHTALYAITGDDHSAMILRKVRVNFGPLYGNHWPPFSSAHWPASCDHSAISSQRFQQIPTDSSRAPSRLVSNGRSLRITENHWESLRIAMLTHQTAA